MKIIKSLLCLALLVPLASCIPQQPKTKSRVMPPVEWQRNDEAQYSYLSVKEASKLHGGSIPVSKGLNRKAIQTAEGRSREVIQAPSSYVKKPQRYVEFSELKVVLGPVILEKSDSRGSDISDAGNRIREIISQGIATIENLSLLDSPEDRFNIDSPRPDLARKGVRLVIKGVSSVKQNGGLYKVFLRAVDTASGKVSIIVSGSHKDPDIAAEQASKRLVKKLKRMM